MPTTEAKDGLLVKSQLKKPVDHCISYYALMSTPSVVVWRKHSDHEPYMDSPVVAFLSHMADSPNLFRVIAHFGSDHNATPKWTVLPWATEEEREALETLIAEGRK